MRSVRTSPRQESWTSEESASVVTAEFDDYDCGWSDFIFFTSFSYIFKGSSYSFLIGQCSVGYYGCRCMSFHTIFYQLVCDKFQILHRHIKNDGAFEFGEGWPIDIAFLFSFGFAAGDESYL